MQSDEVLRMAIAEIGVKKLSSELNLSRSLIYRWFEKLDDKGPPSISNPLTRLAEICELTGSLKPLQWLCEQSDGFFVANVALELREDKYSLLHTQKLVKEFGDLLHAIAAGLSEDRTVDREESGRIRKNGRTPNAQAKPL